MGPRRPLALLKIWLSDILSAREFSGTDEGFAWEVSEHFRVQVEKTDARQRKVSSALRERAGTERWERLLLRFFAPRFALNEDWLLRLARLSWAESIGALRDQEFEPFATAPISLSTNSLEI